MLKSSLNFSRINPTAPPGATLTVDYILTIRLINAKTLHCAPLCDLNNFITINNRPLKMAKEQQNRGRSPIPTHILKCNES